MVGILLVVGLLSQGVTDSTQVVQLLPVIVEAARRDGSAGGANTRAPIGLNLSSFVVLGGAAAGLDLSRDLVHSELGFAFDEASSGQAIRCGGPGTSGSTDCLVPWGMYLELNGLVVTPVEAEATFTIKWSTATMGGVVHLALRTVRVRFKRTEGTWIAGERTVLIQS